MRISASTSVVWRVRRKTRRKSENPNSFQSSVKAQTLPKARADSKVTEAAGGAPGNGFTDNFWYADYLADLDFLLDALYPDQSVDLVGHSMGGNVVMLYAGVRPTRVRRLDSWLLI